MQYLTVQKYDTTSGRCPIDRFRLNPLGIYLWLGFKRPASSTEYWLEAECPICDIVAHIFLGEAKSA